TGKRILTSGANSNKLTGNLLEMNFTNNTQHTAKISLVDLPTVRAQAELMSRTTYRVESLASASGTQVISLAGGFILPIETGTASYNFAGVSGRYNVIAGYYDENDGIAQLQIKKGNSILDSWNLNQNRGSASPDTQTFTTRTVASNLSINQGDNFSIFGRENLGEFARVDYLDFVPVSNSVRIEAESATRTNYRVESIASASGGQAISFFGGAASEVGTASFDFTGVSGRYNVVVGYYDENDGIARLEVKKGNAVLDAWNLDQNRGSNIATSQTFTTRTIASGLLLDRGDTFTIAGKENLDEHARIDYIDFISVDNLI
ncbi:MAG: hypothetical protein ACRC2V_11315, partial [Xenococcaceae cyanobacterium]